MLSRFISKPSRFLPFFKPVSSKTHYSCSRPIIGSLFVPKFSRVSALYSTKGDNGNSGNDGSTSSTSDFWRISEEIDHSVDSVFGEDTGSLEGLHDRDTRSDDRITDEFPGVAPTKASSDDVNHGEDGGDIFSGVEEKSGGGDDLWATVDGHVAWRFDGEDEGDGVKDVFGDALEGREIGLTDFGDNVEVDPVKSEEKQQLEMEEKALAAVLKGPSRGFGDLIASSEITDEMLDSLIALRDLEGIQGLPPLSEIEEKRYEKNTSKSSRAEIERQKQEEVAKARVKQIDNKGRAYGTGKRKCSIARVWIQPGEGKLIVNDKDFDVYFPMIDHRATLLRPFSETKTLGMWNVNCTVQGGGTSGQVGAIRLGISRALQNWEPEFRPPLKAAGFLTRDSRVVERKKPGKAKARKSFQWVKR